MHLIGVVSSLRVLFPVCFSRKKEISDYKRLKDIFSFRKNVAIFYTLSVSFIVWSVASFPCVRGLVFICFLIPQVV